MAKLTDEEAITLCMLRGNPPWKHGLGCWYIRERLAYITQHEVEIAWAAENPAGRFYWPTQGEAAQYYCKYYGLTLEAAPESHLCQD